MRPRRWAAIVLGLLVLVVGTLAYAFWQWNTPDRLTWKQLERALEAPDVKTKRNLLVHISELPIDERQRTYYRDEENWDDSSAETFAEFLAQECSNAKVEGPRVDPSPKAVSERLQRKIRWKTPDGNLENVKRVAHFISNRATKLQDIAHWGVPVFFTVFIGEDDVILGWYRTEL